MASTTRRDIHARNLQYFGRERLSTARLPRPPLVGSLYGSTSESWGFDIVSNRELRWWRTAADYGAVRLDRGFEMVSNVATGADVYKCLPSGAYQGSGQYSEISVTIGPERLPRLCPRLDLFEPGRLLSAGW